MSPKPNSRRRVPRWVWPRPFGWVFDALGELLSEAVRSSSVTHHHPEALIACLDAEGFEHTLRLAVSLGGDSDTEGAIAGGVGEVFSSAGADLREGSTPRLQRSTHLSVHESPPPEA
jgi:ADP-ribosylglycohydrolase